MNEQIDINGNICFMYKGKVLGIYYPKTEWLRFGTSPVMHVATSKESAIATLCRHWKIEVVSWTN